MNLALLSSVVAAAGAIVDWYKNIDKNPDGLEPVQDISLIEFRKRIKNMEKAIKNFKSIDGDNSDD